MEDFGSIIWIIVFAGFALSGGFASLRRKAAASPREEDVSDGPEYSRSGKPHPAGQRQAGAPVAEGPAHPLDRWLRSLTQGVPAEAWPRMEPDKASAAEPSRRGPAATADNTLPPAVRPSARASRTSPVPAPAPSGSAERQGSKVAVQEGIRNQDSPGAKPYKAPSVSECTAQQFDLRQAVIYSEILKPKFDEE